MKLHLMYLWASQLEAEKRIPWLGRKRLQILTGYFYISPARIFFFFPRLFQRQIAAAA